MSAPVAAATPGDESGGAQGSSQRATHLGENVMLHYTARRWLAHRVATGEIEEVTAAGYRYHLDTFCAVVGERVDARSVGRWQREITRLAVSTRRNHFSTVKRFLDHLVERRRLGSNPLIRVKAPTEPTRRPRALSDPNPVVAFCADPRTRLIVLLELQEACRRVEVARLQLGDVDLSNNELHLVGKGHHQRIVSLTLQTRLALNAYLVERGPTAGPLIRSRVHPERGISAQMIGRIVSAHLLEVGVKTRYGDGVAGHCLRHTALSDMLRNGAHVRDVQAAAGHQHLHTTELYIPTTVNGLKRAMGGRWYGHGDAGELPPAA